MSEQELIQRLETRHPIWEANRRSWREIEDVLFDHVKEHLNEYLERGDDEDPMDYERRLRFARFKGELSPILHRLVGAVTSRPPSRPKDIMSKWGHWLENFDGCSSHVDQFLEDRLFEALGFGASAILIDRPMVDENGFSREETSKNFRPELEVRRVEDDELVAVPYRINQVVDWSTDRCGEFHWVRLYERTRQCLDVTQESEVVEVYREFDRSGWRVYEVRETEGGRASRYSRKAELVAEGLHNLGMVPLVIVSLQKEGPMSFYSPMRYAYHHDVSNFIADADLQYSSWIHAHPTLVDYTSTDEATRVTVGPGATIRRNPEYSEEVKYLQFPTATSEELRNNKHESVEGLKRISGIDPLSGTSDPQANASGRSRAISFSISEERHLRRAAKCLAQAEQRIFEIAERWISPDENTPPNRNLLDVRVVYPQVFTNAGTEGLIEQWLATRGMINSETYDKEMQVKIVDSALGDLSADKRAVILEEIEKNELLGGQQEAETPDEEYDLEKYTDFGEAMAEQEDVEDVLEDEREKGRLE